MNQLKFQTIREGRQRYFCEYNPPIANHRFATLDITFPNVTLVADVTRACELEIEIWVKRYGVPVMLTAWDAAEEQIALADPYGKDVLKDKLVGWINPSNQQFQSAKTIKELTYFLDQNTTATDWANIYKRINFIDLDEARANAAQSASNSANQIRLFKLLLGFWVGVIPITWAIIEFFGPVWLGIIVTLYAIYKPTMAALKVWGYLKPNAQETLKLEKVRLNTHYQYHCELNPDGFSRLKNENFTSQAEKNIREEAERLGVKLDKML